METLVEKDFFSWHLTDGINNFIKSRQKSINDAVAFFDFADLFKHLFAPYRRMVISGKTTLFDRLSFNITSSLVGAGARLTLIIAGAIMIPIVVILNSLAIIIFILVPVFSIGGYLSYKQNLIFDSDLKDTQTLVKKLTASPLFKELCLFFDTSFVNLFAKLPAPQTLKLASVKPAQILASILANWPELTSYLQNNHLKAKHLQILIKYIDEHLQNPPVAKPKPIGQALAFGYTNTLDQFGIDLTEKFLPVAYVKREMLFAIEKILTRTQNNNVILVGEPGVGRHTFLESLSAAIQRQMLSSLLGHRVILLDTIALLRSGIGAQTNDQSQKISQEASLIVIKANFEAILAEAKRAGNIILAIDQIDKIISDDAGGINLSGVLTSILTDNSLPIIGITTPDDFNQFIRPNSSILALFEKVVVTETNPDETIFVLIGKALEFHKNDKVKTTLAAILEIVDKSNRLVSDRQQPEKSILLLEDATAQAKGQKSTQVTPALVDEIISAKTKTPVGKITQSEAKKLTDLEAILHKRIVGQDEAIVAIARALRRARAGVEVGNRPIGSFLFLGPTGVGKTETAKVLTRVYFGSELRMIRLDMSEYAQSDGLRRLIGDLQTKSQGHLANLVRENPYSLLLCDEFEKANLDVVNLFLQIFEEGFMTDAFGKKISFDNIIIIATSNAGAEYIREEVQKQVDSSRLTVDSQKNPTVNREPLTRKLINFVLSKNLFSPELINRFDSVVVYQPLTSDQVVQVTSLMLADLTKSLKDTKNISLEITSELAQIIAQKGFDPAFGARPIRRLIADKLEDGIAKMIIEEKVKNGQTIPAQTLLQFVS